MERLDLDVYSTANWPRTSWTDARSSHICLAVVACATWTNCAVLIFTEIIQSPFCSGANLPDRLTLGKRCLAAVEILLVQRMHNAHFQVALVTICVSVPVLYSVEVYNLFHSNVLHPCQRQIHTLSDLESICTPSSFHGRPFGAECLLLANVRLMPRKPFSRSSKSRESATLFPG